MDEATRRRNQAVEDAKACAARVQPSLTAIEACLSKLRQVRQDDEVRYWITELTAAQEMAENR